MGTRHPSESKACTGPSKTYLACGAWREPVEKLLVDQVCQSCYFTLCVSLFVDPLLRQDRGTSLEGALSIVFMNHVR
jgi:hypothetical protein